MRRPGDQDIRMSGEQEIREIRISGDRKTK